MVQKLNYHQNLRAAIVFLNIWGLVLKEENNLKEGETLLILNSLNEEVGGLFLGQDKVKITATTAFGDLYAEYEYATADGLADHEAKFSPVAYFIDWSHKIKFILGDNIDNDVKGEFLMRCSMDTEFGLKCVCHPLLEFYVDGNKALSLKFVRDGKLFAAEYKEAEKQELIYFTPFDCDGVAMSHTIVDLKMDPGIKNEQYRKQAVVRKDLCSDKISTLKYEVEKDNINYYEELLHDITPIKEELVIQKGLLMQEIDSELYQKIKNIRTSLTENEVSLWDNLVNVSLQSYTNAEIIALFGIERKPMKFQNGANNVVDAYFGLSKEKIFLLQRKQNN